MELAKKYSIAYKGLKDGAHRFDFDVDGALFAAYESRDIKDGRCAVRVEMRKSDTQIVLDVAIEGEAVCECDRCLEDCTVPVRFEGTLTVRVSDECGEYDGETMWISPAEDEIDLTQYIYESIVLSLPYQRVHPEGGCDPDMLARFAIVSESEFEHIEAQAADGGPHGISDEDFGKLAALKADMESGGKKM